MSNEKNPIKRLLAAGEDKWQDFVDELVTNPTFAEAMGRSIDKLMATKGKVDRNVRFARNLANLPAKEDYDDLVRKVAKIGDNVTRLETRLDKIIVRLDALAEQAKTKTK